MGLRGGERGGEMGGERGGRGEREEESGDDFYD